MRFQNDQILPDPPRCFSSSLIHELACYKQANFCLYILRDDLLNPPFNGSKHRKYEGLFQKILNRGYKDVVIPASIASNHLVTSVYLCKQHNLKPLVFTKMPYGDLRPNAKATLHMLEEGELFLTDDYQALADRYVHQHPQSFLMPLGGFSQEAALSSLSLGYDIFAFHQKTPLDHIILDAGTGLQAASCLIALQDKGFKGHAHIICMGALDFDKVLDQVAHWTQKTIPSFPIHSLPPALARSYGSSNQRLLDFQKDFFAKTNIILDTVYNAKSFYTLFEMQKKGLIQGSCLIVHSGGTYAL